MARRPYTAADLCRLLYESRTLDLDASLTGEPCMCRDRAIAHARRIQAPDAGQVDLGDWTCRDPYTFHRADGSIGAVLDCRAGAAVVDALIDDGIPEEGIDGELIHRLDRAAERERQAVQGRAA